MPKHTTAREGEGTVFYGPEFARRLRAIDAELWRRTGPAYWGEPKPRALPWSERHPRLARAIGTVGAIGYGLLMGYLIFRFFWT